MNKQEQMIPATERYEQSIHKPLVSTLLGSHFPEETKERMIAAIKNILQTDGAKWNVTIDGMQLSFIPDNQEAIDQVYTGPEAEAMKTYLDHWKELKRITDAMLEPVKKSR